MHGAASTVSAPVVLLILHTSTTRFPDMREYQPDQTNSRSLRNKVVGIVCEDMEMASREDDIIDDADIVMSCPDPQAVMVSYRDELGFRLDLIYPADNPRILLLAGHGLKLCLLRDRASESSGASGSPSVQIVSRGESAWTDGRAGMQYRDLIPGRMDGRYIASHIRIRDAGPVPDYVHYHDVCFQLIYCYKGWVRVVYQDQGKPFVMRAGDCILQPPGIRHRVLECSAGLEVVEISCPAEHETHVDHDMDLPVENNQPDRLFDGQRFLHFRHAEKFPAPSRRNGFTRTDTGIAAASSGTASAAIVTRTPGSEEIMVNVDTDLYFLFILLGHCTLTPQAQESRSLASGAAVSARNDSTFTVTGLSADFTALLVTSPG